jgi:hypothetical protein
VPVSDLQKYNSLDINSPKASINFSMMLSKHIDLCFKPPYEELVFVCIGTDRSTGDALGPIIGHKLSFPLSKYDYIHLHGTLDNPVHAKNLQENLDVIYGSLLKLNLFGNVCLFDHVRQTYLAILRLKFAQTMVLVFPK